MAMRTTRSVEQINKPFYLPGIKTRQPAGQYLIDHDEESIEGLTWIAWQRTISHFHIPSVGTLSLVQQSIPLTTEQLEKILETRRDLSDSL